MKIKSVKGNNRKRAFEVTVFNGQKFEFPYSQLSLQPTTGNRISCVEVDKELGKEAFTYTLDSGEMDTVHIDHVLHFVNEPNYVRELTRHRMSLVAAELISTSGVAKKEIIRRLKTSASQLDRLIDPTEQKTSIDMLLMLLVACDCRFDVTIGGESIIYEGEMETV